MEMTNKATLLGHQAAIYTIAAVPKNPGSFYSAGGDGWLVQWEIQKPDLGKAVAEVGEPVFSILPLEHENTVLLGTMNGAIFKVVVGSPTQTRNIRHPKFKSIYALVNLEKNFLSVNGAGALVIWDKTSLQPIESLKLTNHHLRSVIYSKERNEIVVGTGGGDLFFLNASSLEIKNTFVAAHANTIFSLLYLPDSQHLLSGGRDAMIRVWNLNTFLKVTEFPAHLYTVNDMQLSRNQKWVATASRDRTIKLWDATTLKLSKVLDRTRSNGHLNSVNKLLWLEDILISGSDDKTLKIWE